MDFETRWMEDFLALASTQSFSRAAERRHVTQPAFSRRIKSLENAVGVTLVDRSTTPVALTPEGQLFLVTARSIVGQLHESIARLRGLQPHEQQVIEVAAAHSLAFTFFPDWLSTLGDLTHNLSIRLVAMNVEDAIVALREGQCDLMQVYYDSYATLQLDPAIFPSIQLSETLMLPVCKPNADGEPIYSLDSQNEDPLPYLAYTSGAFLGRTVRLLLKHDPVRLRLKTVYETAMAEGLKGMALQGRGIAWMPRLCIERELEEKRLVVCGSAQWQTPLEIRLYRCALIKKPAIETLWAQLGS
ncbi:LysR family transcriptional regulator [Nitrincola alkalilacustris]|uniref:LysR family transcriptional regulator n=1 Tax=Nitrincola alkalilacustris TaxID=1571224 RepID=UPI00124DB016|nr:LysR family transcriptional regulator [Nitrincola alkalilacustris]